MARIQKRTSLLEELESKYQDNPDKLSKLAFYGFLSNLGEYHSTIEQLDRGLEILHRAKELYRQGAINEKEDATYLEQNQGYLFCLENLANFELARSRIRPKSTHRISDYITYNRHPEGGLFFERYWRIGQPTGLDEDPYHIDSREQNPKYQSHLDEAINLFKELWALTKDRTIIPEDMWGHAIPEIEEKVDYTPPFSAETDELFEYFGITRSATYKQAKAAWRRKAFEIRPDLATSDLVKQQQQIEFIRNLGRLQVHYVGANRSNNEANP